MVFLLLRADQSIDEVEPRARDHHCVGVALHLAKQQTAESSMLAALGASVRRE